MSLLGDFFKNPRESLSDAWGNIKNIAKDPFDKDNIKDNARMIFDFIDPAASSLYGTANSLDETFGGAQGGGGSQSPYANIPLSNAGMEALPAAYQGPQAPAQWNVGQPGQNPYIQGEGGLRISMPHHQAEQQRDLAMNRYLGEVRARETGAPNNPNLTGKYNQLAYDLSQGQEGQSNFDGGNFNYTPAPQPPPYQGPSLYGGPTPNFGPQRLEGSAGSGPLAQSVTPDGFRISPNMGILGGEQHQAILGGEVPPLPQISTVY